MCEAFLLVKVIKVSFGVKEVASVGGSIEEVKEGDHWLEFIMGLKEVSYSCSGAAVEHVLYVKEEEHSKGVVLVGEESVHRGSGKV